MKKLKNLPVGGEFLIGEDCFIVLDQEDDKTFVVSKNHMLKNQMFGYTLDYKESELRKKIEEEIQPKIEAEVGAENILEHVVDLVTVDMKRDFGTLNCKVRPFTFDEARKYNDLLVNKELDDWTWTCTPWTRKESGWGNAVACIWRLGDLDYGSGDCGDGVRPVMWLKNGILVRKE